MTITKINKEPARDAIICPGCGQKIEYLIDLVQDDSVPGIQIRLSVIIQGRADECDFDNSPNL